MKVKKKSVKWNEKCFSSGNAFINRRTEYHFSEDTHWCTQKMKCLPGQVPDPRVERGFHLMPQGGCLLRIRQMQQRRGRSYVPTWPGVSRVKVRVGTDEVGLRLQDLLV